jgi:PAS domain S-box-containing protein
MSIKADVIDDFIGSRETENMKTMSDNSTILAVDDHPESLALLVNVLGWAGYQVRPADSGKLALVAVAAQPPDLILLDMRMPDLDGLEVCRRLKANEATRHVPIILLSAFAEVQEWVAGLEAGAVDYLVKPFHAELLLARVKAHLSLGRAYASLARHDAALRQANAQLQAEIAERQRAATVMATRLRLLQFGQTHSLTELLQSTLDEVETLTGSQVGFFHFVAADQTTLSLQAWSTNTTHHLCRAAGAGRHYPVLEAGVWVDALRAREPVIHNDYAALPHRKGLPEGHTPIIRELVVPVLRATRIVALLGVGNKPIDYDATDIEMVASLADLTWDIAERKRAEESLRESDSRFLAVAAHTPDHILMQDCDLRYLFVINPPIGLTPADVIGRTDHDFLAREDAEKLTAIKREVLDTGQPQQVETSLLNRQGQTEYFEGSYIPSFDSAGRINGLIGYFRNITERKQSQAEQAKLQGQLQHSQKMQAVGHLAGGVAHDFNNMIQAILSNVDMALDDATPGSAVCPCLEEIRKAGHRSADLVRQLLTFASQQTIAPQVLNLNETVEGLLKLLRRLIGEDIHLTWAPAAHLGAVKMDPTQVDQILANLCVNARDAIGGVGSLTIETEHAVIDEAYCEDHPEFLPGKYVRLTVSDDGCGMDKDTQARIFEPFFTTKSSGEGTGLGLATVYGIVKQNGGHIQVYSELGHGTSFRIYLPCFVGEAAPAPMEPTGPLPGSSGETVLLVEDEPSLLAISQKLLHRLGYTVLSADTPGQAIQLAETHAGKIHLLMTDVVMPGMNGQNLARQLVARHPQLRCLFMSGYTSDVIGRHCVLDKGVHFIQKPFSLQDLAAKLRTVLEPAQA